MTPSRVPAVAVGRDVLEQGDPEAPTRRRPVVVVAVVALALLAAGWAAGWADGWKAEDETSQVLAEVAAVEDEVGRAQARIAGMVAYAWPVLTAPDIDPALRADLAGLVSEAAGQALVPLQERRTGIAGVSVLPWHDDVRAARDAALAYVDARVDELAAIAADAGARAEVRPEVSAARELLRRALLGAGTDPALAQRVEGALPGP